jgi:hypothetical protein
VCGGGTIRGVSSCIGKRLPDPSARERRFVAQSGSRLLWWPWVFVSAAPRPCVASHGDDLPADVSQQSVPAGPGE